MSDRVADALAAALFALAGAAAGLAMLGLFALALCIEL